VSEYQYSPEVMAEREELGKVEVALVGEDGNAYAIMGRVSRALKAAGYSKQAIEEYGEASRSGDYNHLLRVAMDWTEDIGEDEDEDLDSQMCEECGQTLLYCECE
jgi:hypothetical protein